MKSLAGLALGLFIGLAASFGFNRAAVAEDQSAYAMMINSNGQSVGTARFVESAAGDVRVVLDVKGLTPGEHGFHIHAVGLCDPAAFTTAGAHFNPNSRQHGLGSSQGPHAGDLPNLVAGPDGSAYLDMTFARFTLTAGTTSILDADGSALIIHADRDDGSTDPTGNSGARVACGVVAKGAPQAASGTTVSPPRTGDGGLIADDSDTAAWKLALPIVAIVASGAFVLLHRSRRKAQSAKAID